MTIYNPINRSQTRSMNRGDSSVEMFGSLIENHTQVLRQHGYSPKGNGIYVHPSGHIARTSHEGTEIHRNGRKLNTLSGSSDLHGYLTDLHPKSGANHAVSAGAAMDPAVKKTETFRAPAGVSDEAHKKLTAAGYKYSHSKSFQGAPAGRQTMHVYKHADGSEATHYNGKTVSSRSAKYPNQPTFEAGEPVAVFAANGELKPAAEHPDDHHSLLRKGYKKTISTAIGRDHWVYAQSPSHRKDPHRVIRQHRYVHPTTGRVEESYTYNTTVRDRAKAGKHYKPGGDTDLAGHHNYLAKKGFKYHGEVKHHDGTGKMHLWKHKDGHAVASDGENWHSKHATDKHWYTHGDESDGRGHEYEGAKEAASVAHRK